MENQFKAHKFPDLYKKVKLATIHFKLIKTIIFSQIIKLLSTKMEQLRNTVTGVKTTFSRIILKKGEGVDIITSKVFIIQ